MGLGDVMLVRNFLQENLINFLISATYNMVGNLYCLFFSERIGEKGLVSTVCAYSLSFPTVKKFCIISVHYDVS